MSQAGADESGVGGAFIVLALVTLYALILNGFGNAAVLAPAAGCGRGAN